MNLQKAAAGFLGAFDLKVTGKNPDKVEDAIRGVFESLDLYLAVSQRRLVSRGAYAWAAGTDAFLAPPTANAADTRVPTGKVWRVWAVTAILQTAAADAALTFNGKLQIVEPSGTNFVDAVVEPFRGNSTAAAGHDMHVTYFFPRPLLLTSGWRMQAVLQGSAVTAGASQVFVTLMYDEFDL